MRPCPHRQQVFVANGHLVARVPQQDASPLAVDGDDGAEVAVEVNAFEADEQDAHVNLCAMGSGVLAEGGVERREATLRGIGQRVAEVGIERREATLWGVGHQVVEQQGQSGWSAEGSPRRKRASRSENFFCGERVILVKSCSARPAVFSTMAAVRSSSRSVFRVTKS